MHALVLAQSPTSMRTNTYLIRTSFLLAAALALTPAIGATVTWDTSTTAGFQSGNGTWGTDSFWSSNGTTLSPWISGDTASFLGQTTAVNDTITIGSNQTIGGLAFGSATTSGNWTFSGSGLSLSANSTFTVNAGSTASIGNVITGAFGLTKAGTGNLSLTGANTYTGVTTVSAGTLTLASGASLASSGFTTAAGATLALNASTTVTTLSGFGNIQIGSGATLTLNNSTGQSIGSGGASSLASTGAFSGAGTFVKTGTGLLYVQGDFSSTTTNVTLSGGSFQFVGSSGADTNAFGTGTITVTANSTLNTFTDATRTKSSRLLNAIVVTGGTLALGTGSGGSGSLTLAGGLTATNAANVTVGGGRVILESDLAVNGTGAFTLTGGTLQLGNNTATGSINGGLAFNATAGSLIFNRSDNATYSGVFSGTGSLTQAGTGNLTLTSANTYTGVTTVSAGTLTLDSGGAIGTGVVTVSGTGVLDLGGQAVANSFVVNGGTLQGGVLNIAKITATSGVISSDLSGTTGFTKTGTGTLILGGTNSYTGGTSVNGGTLLVNGTIGAITVASGGTLGGNGFVGNTSVSSGGTIAAGASVGLLNVANLTLAAGSALTWQLNDSTKIAGVGYDLIVASTLDLSGLSSGSRATLNLMTLANPGDGVSGTPVAFDKDLSQSFTLINYSALNLGTNTNVSNLFSISLNGFVAQDGSALNPGNFSVINDAANNSLKLQYVSAVPEPSTYGLALGFLSLAVVAVRRQRRKAAAQA